MKKTIRRIIATAIAVITPCVCTATAARTDKSTVFGISASAASYSEYDARNDAVTVSNHPYLISYYRSTNNKTVVSSLQRLLNHFCGCGLSVDGVFGNATASGVKTLQRSYSLYADGIVGKDTKNLLLSLTASSPARTSGRLDLNTANAYCSKYAYSRNYAYPYYANQNCQNFISQALCAAGMSTDQTFYSGSYAFVNVVGFKDCMVSRGVRFISYPSASQIQAGDVIWTGSPGTHAMFVQRVSGGTIYCAGNTNNRLNYPVSASCISGVVKTSALF